MLNRAYRLSLSWKFFTDKCEALKMTFSNLFYPSKLIDATINKFITSRVADNVQSDTMDNGQPSQGHVLPSFC